MERQQVESSQIKSIGFEVKEIVEDFTEGARTTIGHLEVEFATGAIYSYSNVEQETFDALMKAESLGRYFGQVIKTNPAKYPFIKVRESDKNIEKAAASEIKGHGVEMARRQIWRERLKEIMTKKTKPVKAYCITDNGKLQPQWCDPTKSLAIEYAQDAVSPFGETISWREMKKRDYDVVRVEIRRIET